MPTWTVKADRRRAKIDPIIRRLRSLEESVQGLEVSFVDDAFEQAPDAGNFRDFAPLAKISHDKTRALKVVAEELITQFGWRIDLSRGESPG